MTIKKAMIVNLKKNWHKCNKKSKDTSCSINEGVMSSVENHGKEKEE